MTEEKKHLLGDFFSFKIMISLSIVKIIYAIGFVIITAIGIVTMVSGISDYSGFLGIIAGLMIILFGNIVWRVLCEWWVVFFSMHEQIVKIEENTQTQGKGTGNINLNISRSTESNNV